MILIKKEVIMKAVRIFLLTLLVMVPVQAKNITMTKAYHHQGMMSDKVVFYFSQRPICTYVPSVSASGQNGEKVLADKNGQVELEFFLPITQAAKKAQKFITQLGATNNNLYRVQFEPDYAKGGLTCRVVFRPDEIGFQQESFAAITGEHALAFSFVRRKAIQDINKTMGPILRSAQVKKKSMLLWTADMESMIRVL
jgi:hypothetical protein